MPTDPFSPQENVGNYTELREAANQLSTYVSYATRTKIIGTEIRAPGAAGGGLVSASDQAKFIELLVGSTEPVPLYDLVSAEISKIGQAKSAIKLYRLAPGEETSPVDSGSTPGDVKSDASKKVIPIIPTDVGNLDKKKRVVSAVYHGTTEFTDMTSLLSDISAMFCNIVPPTELSLCVPYFDVNIIYPKRYSSNGSDSGSTVSSLSLTNYVGDQKSDYQAYGAKIGYDIAGMEIFSMPQTLGPTSDFLNNPIAAARRGVTVLDPIMPLMTIESANIQQVGLGGSLYAQTKIDLKLSLHDRSRLSEIEDLVSAQSFPNVNFRITYGWSHPNSNKMTGNVYAKLINAMRITQDFVVSSVSIGSKETIGLSISLSLVSAGSQTTKNAKVISGLGKYVPYSILQPLIKQAVTFRTKNTKDAEKFVSVGTTIVSSTSTATSASKFIEVSKFYEFKKLLESLTSPDSALTDGLKVRELASALNNIETTETTDLGLGFAELFEFPNEVSYASYYTPIVEETTGYAKDMDDTLAKHQFKAAVGAASGQGEGGATESRPAVIPLGVALMRYVAAPIFVSMPEIDEVRIHSYCFNTSAGLQSGQNISNFPIIINDLIEQRDDKGKSTRVITSRTTVDQIISLLMGQVNKPASIFYGHDEDLKEKQKLKEAAEAQIKTLAEESGTELGENSEPDPAIVAAAEKIEADFKATQSKRDVDSAVTNAKYMEKRQVTDPADTSFRPPRIKIHFDVVPAYDKEGSPTLARKRIARIHVYDERAAGINKKSNFLVSLLNSQSGIASVANKAALSEDVSKILTKIEKADGGATTDTYYAIRDKSIARKLISDAYPTLIIGSDSGIITNASFTSQPSGDVASAYLLTALEGGTTSDPSGNSVKGDIVDDILITPTTVTLSMLGNVLITRGQTYYIDFNTGTTLDNTYTVSSVTHALKPGGFTTSVTLAPVFSATMKSATRQINEIVSLLQSRLA